MLEIHRNREFYRTNDVRPPFTYASLIRQVRIFGNSIIDDDTLKQSHKKKSSDNILQITISTRIYNLKKYDSLGIKLFLKQKFAKPSE